MGGQFVLSHTLLQRDEPGAPCGELLEKAVFPVETVADEFIFDATVRAEGASNLPIIHELDISNELTDAEHIRWRRFTALWQQAGWSLQALLNKLQNSSTQG